MYVVWLRICWSTKSREILVIASSSLTWIFTQIQPGFSSQFLGSGSLLYLYIFFLPNLFLPTISINMLALVQHSEQPASLGIISYPTCGGCHWPIYQIRSLSHSYVGYTTIFLLKSLLKSNYQSYKYLYFLVILKWPVFEIIDFKHLKSIISCNESMLWMNECCCLN